MRRASAMCHVNLVEFGTMSFASNTALLLLTSPPLPTIKQHRTEHQSDVQGSNANLGARRSGQERDHRQCRSVQKRKGRVWIAGRPVARTSTSPPAVHVLTAKARLEHLSAMVRFLKSHVFGGEETVVVATFGQQLYPLLSGKSVADGLFFPVNCARQVLICPVPCCHLNLLRSRPRGESSLSGGQPPR